MKKSQFLLLSTIFLIISMFTVFVYFQSSSDASTILFQPAYSAEAMNLFRSIEKSNTWLENNWYNFSEYQARRQILNITGTSGSFNITVSCDRVAITDSLNINKSITTSGSGDECTVEYNNMEFGDYIYYYLNDYVTITPLNNITAISLEESPIYYNGIELRSKLCEHLTELYKSKQIQLNCSFNL